MKSSRLLLPLLSLAISCADDGDAGKNSLVLTSQEAAGTHCVDGGVKVESGLDSNGNGKLEATEVTSTEYVCSGSDGTDGKTGADGGTASSGSVLGTEVTDAGVTDCPTGGKQIQFVDADGGAVGDPVVLCGQSASDAFGPTPTATARRAANLTGVVAGEEYSATGSVTVLSAEITVPGAGTVVAFGSSLAYCDSTGTAPTFGKCYSASPGTTAAWLTILQSTAPSLSGNSGESTFQYLSPDVDNAMSVSTTFPVGAAGKYTFVLVGLASDVDHALEMAPQAPTDGPVESRVYYGGSELTLAYLPH